VGIAEDLQQCTLLPRLNTKATNALGPDHRTFVHNDLVRAADHSSMGEEEIREKTKSKNSKVVRFVGQSGGGDEAVGSGDSAAAGSAAAVSGKTASGNAGKNGSGSNKKNKKNAKSHTTDASMMRYRMYYANRHVALGWNTEFENPFYPGASSKNTNHWIALKILALLIGTFGCLLGLKYFLYLIFDSFSLTFFSHHAVRV